MYAIVIANTITLAFSFHDVAPRRLTLDLPAALCVLCLLRVIAWWQSRNRDLSVAQAIGKLRRTIIFASIMSAAFCAWSLSLFPYGDILAKGHVAFFMAVTAIGVAICLMHLRAAVFIVMSFAVIPFAVYFGTSENPVLVGIAFNFIVVAVAVAVMLLGNYKDFEHRIYSEEVLRHKQAELQKLSDINQRNSNADSLTGLPNRRNFFAQLEQGIEEADRNGGLVTMGILDLDGFKAINDVHGHRLGDRIIVAVADRLRGFLPEHVFVARLGGDEFGVFGNDLHTEADLTNAERDLINLFEAPFEIGTVSIRIGCSIGTAQFPEAANTAEDLFERADYALYFAKQNGRGKAERFNAEHEATIREAARTDQALVNADLDQELWIAYQPIVSAATRQPVSFEVLARWHNPELGNVPPMRFIVAAERSGMIGQLTPLLLRKALEGARDWPEHIRISFNLSAVDVASPLSVLKVISVINQSGISPGRIDLEITETSVMGNLALATQTLNALRALGVRISLDDFGTGYSSLSAISELPLDKVKIDRSFINRIDSDPAARLILSTMIGLSAGLGHNCIVEGVETEQQADCLRRLGCRFMQGYLFSRPMRGDEVADYLHNTSERVRIAALCSG